MVCVDSNSIASPEQSNVSLNGSSRHLPTVPLTQFQRLERTIDSIHLRRVKATKSRCERALQTLREPGNEALGARRFVHAITKLYAIESDQSLSPTVKAAAISAIGECEQPEPLVNRPGWVRHCPGRFIRLVERVQRERQQQTVDQSHSLSPLEPARLRLEGRIKDDLSAIKRTAFGYQALAPSPRAVDRAQVAFCITLGIVLPIIPIALACIATKNGVMQRWGVQQGLDQLTDIKTHSDDELLLADRADFADGPATALDQCFIKAVEVLLNDIRRQFNGHGQHECSPVQRLQNVVAHTPPRLLNRVAQRCVRLANQCLNGTARLEWLKGLAEAPNLSYRTRQVAAKSMQEAANGLETD